MKTFTMLLASMFAIFGSATQLHALSALDEKYQPGLYPFEYYWTEDEKGTYFHFTIPENFAFDTNYVSHLVNEGDVAVGQSATVAVLPKEGYKHISNNLEVDRLEITVRLLNAPAEKVEYDLIAKPFYTDKSWFIHETTPFSFESSGFLVGPSVDLTKSVDFKIWNGSIDAGVVFFPRASE